MARVWTWRNAILKSDLAATTKHVLMVISVHMNDMGGGCYPSTKTIARLASLSERSVCTHIEIAELAGWLRVRRHGFGGQDWARNEYEPLWPQGTETSSTASQKGTEPLSEGAEADDKKALKEVQPKFSEELPNEHHLNLEFDKVWAKRWGRGDAADPRKPALVSFVRARRKGASFEDIMSSVVAKVGVDKAGTQYAPRLVTWLNEERWKDVAAGNSRSAEEIAAATRRHEEAAQRSKAHLDNLARQRSNQLLGLSDDAA
jgi:hypothetical protein